jgi:hypothetical protein
MLRTLVLTDIAEVDHSGEVIPQMADCFRVIADGVRDHGGEVDLIVLNGQRLFYLIAAAHGFAEFGLEEALKEREIDRKASDPYAMSGGNPSEVLEREYRGPFEYLNSERPGDTCVIYRLEGTN